MSCNHDHHDHDGHDCCDHTHECEQIKLVLEDDREVICDVICIFDLDDGSDREYIALAVPCEGEDGEEYESEIIVYRYSETEDGEISLDVIEEDAELDAAHDALDEIFDEEEDSDFYEKDE